MYHITEKYHKEYFCGNNSYRVKFIPFCEANQPHSVCYVYPGVRI